ncbi:minor capsid protein [Streptococcus mitis]|uniref:minor capsid protein n=1 Tax=Streptococcus mitis TaxID=28037 RepID=UPI0021B847CA|nr:minor capsid protein [Streptococcus mitis]
MTTENKKKIDEYWTERALQQEQNAQIVADRYMAQIGQSLADYKHQLVSEIEKFYARYAVDNKMTHAEAKQYLTDKERREFKHVTLERFREMALNPDTPTPLLDALSYRHRISRKEALLAEIERLTAELYGKPDGIHDKVTEALSDVYIKGKIHQAKNLAHFGIIEKPILGVDAVRHKMASNWSGKTFSTNVWGHDAAVYKSISDTINKGLTGGWSVDRMARALSERTGVAYHRADTLVRTETTFYNNLATLDTIKELGGDHYEIVAVLDSRTSEICRLENHEVHSVKEYEPGRTAPPFHVRCRSTIRPAVKSDKPSPYFNILQNNGSVKLATEKRSLDEIFAGWEREGEAVKEKLFAKDYKEDTKSTDKFSEGLDTKIKTLANFSNNSKKWYNDYVEKTLSIEDIETVSEKLKEVFANSSYAMRFKSENIDKLIDSSRFLNQFETGTSGGTVNTKYRRQANEQLFGLQGKRLKKPEFEKYGYFGNKDPYEDFIYNLKAYAGVEQYGDIIVHFSKEKIADRTTFTINNSLGPAAFKDLVADNPNKPRLVGIDKDYLEDYTSILKNTNIDTPEKVSKSLGIRYVEAQYHGEVLLSDVSSMYFTDSIPTNKQVESLKKIGIKLFMREGDRFVRIK